MARVPKNPWDSVPQETTNKPAETSAAEQTVATDTDSLPSESSTPVVPPAGEIPESPSVIEGELLDMVIVTVPKDYILALTHHNQQHYKAGVQRMERSHAEHWWSKANGVTLFEG